ncbi:MAG: FtsX-like permease family protein [Alphaproteobacteria bacterium]|nr:FtsX-like permease family protein [Alphaproteobacteria bacterium]
MSPLYFVLTSIGARPLQSILCIVAAASGVAMLCALLLLSGAVNEAAARNSRGIDIVVGAKGSPLQLILSTIYHADVPTGNMSGASAAIISRHPQIKRAIPLALGDSVRGYRIVGTSPDYLSLYNAKIADGAMWDKPMQAVAGSMTGFKTGDRFAGSHGLSAGGEEHANHIYHVTGTLAPTGTVVDRLVLTSVQSVYEIHFVIPHDHATEEKADNHAHDHDEHEHEENEHDHAHEHGASSEEEPHDHGPDTINHPVTALLLQTHAPYARINLPREINSTSNLIAAVPSLEIANLMRRFGFGRDAMVATGMGLVALSSLMILTTLASGLAARRYDLAVLRVLGGSPLHLLLTTIAEALLLGLAGGIIGILAGHAVAWAAVRNFTDLGGIIAADMMLMPVSQDLMLLAVACGAALLAALIPAIMAARTDIAGLLARGQA